MSAPALGAKLEELPRSFTIELLSQESSYQEYKTPDNVNILTLWFTGTHKYAFLIPISSTVGDVIVREYAIYSEVYHHTHRKRSDSQKKIK